MTVTAVQVSDEIERSRPAAMAGGGILVMDVVAGNKDAQTADDVERLVAQRQERRGGARGVDKVLAAPAGEGDCLVFEQDCSVGASLLVDDVIDAVACDVIVGRRGRQFRRRSLQGFLSGVGPATTVPTCASSGH